MNEPPVDIANFRARAHAIAVEKKAKRQAGPFLDGQAKGKAEPPKIIARRASDIAPEPISWLWKYWLARIHFIEETIPAGAKSRPFNPATDMAGLVEKAKSIGDVALLILDPVVAAVPMTRNSHNNAETRNGMQPVVDFAKASDTAVIGITHLTKGTSGKDPLERLNGSGAFGALPRLVMGAAKNEAEGDGEPERIMVRIKSNIGSSGGGFGYHIDMATLLENPAIEATRIVWEHELEGTAKELLNAAEGDQDGKVSKLDEAKRFLREALSKGGRLRDEIEKEAAAQNIKWGTLKRASEGGEVIKKKDGMDGPWIWSLT